MDHASPKLFSATELEAIARALGHTDDGLPGSEIGTVLLQCRIDDVASGETKWRRAYCALADRQNRDQKRNATLAFIRVAMKPARHLHRQERYEALRTHLNRALTVAGLAVQEDGELVSSDQARTLPEAERRAQDLRSSLEARGVHPDVLEFCRAELLADNYFHAVSSFMTPLAKEATRLHRARASQAPSSATARLRIMPWKLPISSRASTNSGTPFSVAATASVCDLDN
jgi:hypothetical protein